MTDKEKLELINLRNRVSNQREEIKRLRDLVEDGKMNCCPNCGWRKPDGKEN